MGDLVDTIQLGNQGYYNTMAYVKEAPDLMYWLDAHGKEIYYQYCDFETRRRNHIVKVFVVMDLSAVKGAFDYMRRNSWTFEHIGKIEQNAGRAWPLESMLAQTVVMGSSALERMSSMARPFLTKEQNERMFICHEHPDDTIAGLCLEKKLGTPTLENYGSADVKVVVKHFKENPWGSKENLPPGWEKGFSQTHSKNFYFDSVTGQRSWKRPSTFHGEPDEPLLQLRDRKRTTEKLLIRKLTTRQFGTEDQKPSILRRIAGCLVCGACGLPRPGSKSAK